MYNKSIYVFIYLNNMFIFNSIDIHYQKSIFFLNIKI